ncbi:MAG: glycerate kinase [Candidatus Methanomethylophilaceae archaeon]|nr:glycerate kinase [Candidatus Methanomethylophilaceae archaeon]
MEHPLLVLAFDKFRGSLTQAEASEAAEKGDRRALPEAEVVILPCADGGEGTVEAILAACGTGRKRYTCSVTPPLGIPGKESIEASFAVLSGEDGVRTCVLEMCAASGLSLVPEDRRDPMSASTYGTGQMIRAGLDLGCRRFLLGLGGSATHDGGIGMAAALGYRFYDRQGNFIPFPKGSDLPELGSIRTDEADPRLRNSAFTACCDVDNPLCGPSGAAAVFGPQKGAKPEQIPKMDEGLAHLAQILTETGIQDCREQPGVGAAGGTGFGVRAFLGGELKSGIDAVLDAAKADDILRKADLLLTGEGKMDIQTVHGKAVAGLLSRAERFGVPVIGFCGILEDGAWGLYDRGMIGMFSISDRPMGKKDAFLRAKALLEKQVYSAVTLWYRSKTQKRRK